jgi:dihydrofolate reductase
MLGSPLFHSWRFIGEKEKTHDRKIFVYIATSLDGFIARKNGDLDWLPAGEEGGEDFGYAEFMSTIDYVVMGRNTFEKVLTFGGWHYDKK